MWRHLKLLHMWRNFRFLHIFYAEKCEITSHVEKFQISPHLSCEINPHVMKFQISPHLSCIKIWNFSTWQIFLHGHCPWCPWQIWGMTLASIWSLDNCWCSRWSLDYCWCKLMLSEKRMRTWSLWSGSIWTTYIDCLAMSFAFHVFWRGVASFVLFFAFCPFVCT